MLGCCVVDDLLHSSLNLVFIQRNLQNIFIFGMAYYTVQYICFMQEKLTHKSPFTSIMTNPKSIEDLGICTVLIRY